MFARVADAFAGRISIQKEYMKTVVQMKYKDKSTTGTMSNNKSPMSYRLRISYYENEFSTLKKSFSNLRQSDLRLMDLNNQLLQLSQKMAADYNNYPHLIHADGPKSIQDQYAIESKAIQKLQHCAIDCVDDNVVSADFIQLYSCCF